MCDSGDYKLRQKIFSLQLMEFKVNGGLSKTYSI